MGLPLHAPITSPSFALFFVGWFVFICSSSGAFGGSSLWRVINFSGDWAMGYHSMGFRHIPDIS